ncbi:radical SAM protein [Lentzea sp. NBRC 105346]|uniref:intein-containing Rv2578c family radical SAM protein n=1 Tax=Lentzea sp. NBRC 105346 TaxID=3032205 RepID=UPI0024A0D75F|nr:intein-containing Rv2578c family radical SAM protein [Lentzea sp. NBRC 105346]GLZ34752.1 radical SAM protein [Lentzea sp. NBRC 105346]
MRWDGQKVEAEPQLALPGLPGLVRSVRTPEFADVVFHEVRAKSVLNKVPGEGLPFNWSVNPYRGCSHACTYCLAGDTPVLMADGRTKPISELREGDEIYGTELTGNYRRYVRTTVEAHWETRKRAFRVTLEDGTQLVSSGDHRFLTDRGWKHVVGGTCGSGRRPHLTTGNKLMGTGWFAPQPEITDDYRRGYLRGMVGDAREFRIPLADVEAMDRVQEYLDDLGVQEGVGFLDHVRELARWQIAPNDDWLKGFLAGAFDFNGTCSRSILRMSSRSATIIEAISIALKHFDFDFAIEDLKRRKGMRVIRLRGGLRANMRFFHFTDPAITRKRDIDGVAIKSAEPLGVRSIEDLGEEVTLYDITTGTGDFIANGVVSHNCFARNTHTYLDMDAGHDFDSQVIVKINAPEVLAKQLRSSKWSREHVAMGTNTDPYQRAEGRYALMPGIIRALADSGTPFSILTKGTLLSRDLPLLTEAAKSVPVGIGVSLALLERDLHKTLEPGTPTPAARLDLVRKVREAGLPCGVFVAPVLPGLTDSVEQLDFLFGEIARAGATGVTPLPLHLRPGAREWFMKWLAGWYPDLVDGYKSLYGKGSYVDKRYREWFSARVKPLLAKHDLLPKAPTRVVPGDPDGVWPDGALPSGIPSPRVAQEQLMLL